MTAWLFCLYPMTPSMGNRNSQRGYGRCFKKNRFVTAEGTDLIRAFFHDEVANDLTNECMYNYPSWNEALKTNRTKRYRG